MKARCILVTGTLAPNAVVMGPNDSDPDLRRKQYLTVLSFYSEIFDEPIYFLENSAYDFSADAEFRELFEKKGIELIKYAPSDEVERGKGYQEFAMIDAAVDSLSSRYRSFIKLTGRYQYLNIRELTDFDCQGLVMDLWRRTGVAVTSVFYTTFDFYREHLRGLYLDADDSRGQWIEKIIYRIIKEKLKEPDFQERFQLFPLAPVLKIPYSQLESERDTAAKRFKFRVRKAQRAVLKRFSAHELYF